MNWILMLFAVFAGMLLEAAFPTAASLGYARPPVLAAIVVYYALNCSLDMSAIAAAAAGVARDGLLGLPIGCSAFLFMVFSWFIYNHRENWFRKTFFTRALLGALAGALLTAGSYICLRIGGQLPAGVTFGQLASKTLIHALSGMIFTIVIATVMERLERFVGNSAEEKPE